MSRIAGVAGLTNGAVKLADRLARAMSGPTVERSVLGTERVSLAWVGAGSGCFAANARVTSVVDGTFYNPSELEGNKSDGPAKQLIATYLKYGFAGALARINGDFAVALHDERSATLWLGRDRVGVKPLYYASNGVRLAFASRPAALRGLSWVSGEANPRFVAVFGGSHYRYIDNRRAESPFLGISQLPAASYLEVRGDTARTGTYWRLADEPDWTENEADLAARYRHLLIDAVRGRLDCATQPAFTLSGGMDSSSVLASAVEITGRKQHAFSSVYTDKTYDESEEIRGFVSEKVAHWHPVAIEGFDLAATVRRMVRAHDEPVATATWLSHFLLCEHVAASGFGTLFGGLGGDELNAGEYEHFIYHFSDLRRQGRSAELAHEIAEWARHHDHPIYRKNREAAEQALLRLTDPTEAGRIRVDLQRFKRYFGTVRRDYFDLETFIPLLDHPFGSALKNRTYQDIFRETAPCCLRAEDRHCAQFGLVHMDPFFDHRLIELMFRVPGEMKIRDGITKRLLREAMRGLLPEETRMRIKKTGWNAPAHLWFSETGIGQLLDLVHSRAFRERGVYDLEQVLRLIAEHCEIVASGAHRENHMMFLWQLVNLELWFQEVADKSQKD